VSRFDRSEAMTTRSPHLIRSRRGKNAVAARVQKHWDTTYGPLLASQLEVGRRYSIVKVGSAEFAYTRYDQFADALARAWDLGLIPEPRPSALGSDLPGAAPRLRGVDADLGGLDRSEFTRTVPRIRPVPLI
jgi:hypothetical protein